MTVVTPFTPVPITIAGRPVGDAADSVISYLEGRNHRTSKRIFDYDFAALERREAFRGALSARRITVGSIDSANRLRGRLRRSQLTDWYERQEETANWGSVTRSHTFVEADPNVCGGIYDDMCEIWYNFLPMYALGHKAFSVGATQVNKVLHQVLPNLLPIFDEKLRKLYFQDSFRGTSGSICDGVAETRLSADCVSPYGDGFIWEPLRLDMSAITPDQITEIRRQIATRRCENSLVLGGLTAQVWASENLSDVRLVDMIAWQL
jgi:hypothetical protein